MAADLEARIRQFTQMAEADPENELGHFSLGKAYLEAGQAAQAVAPLRRALELNPALSKAYQLLGEALDRSGNRDGAIQTVTRGVTVADEQGDRMPLAAMVKTLGEWGSPVPALKSARTSVGAGGSGSVASGFRCCRCGKPSGQLPKPPFKGAIGAKIFDNVCDTCWREWIAMGTKVINELGLVLSTAHGQEMYDQYMIEFLQLEEV
jgi:Fe-S cluster biosynthesis and repair protein YggX/predicted TPR repeat methyltransferase